MLYICAFSGCPKKLDSLRRERRQITLFRLSRSDTSELKKWYDILSLNTNNLSAAYTERVCSKHFNPDDIVIRNNEISLVTGAVPTWSGKVGKCHVKVFKTKVFATFSLRESHSVSRSQSATSLGNNHSSGRGRACSENYNIADFGADEEIQILRGEVLPLKLQIQPPSLKSFEHDGESISLYTGFLSYAIARLRI